MHSPEVATRLLLAGAVVVALAGSVAQGQAYGDHDQVLTIGAVEVAGTPGGGYLDADGYLRSPSEPMQEMVPVVLPEGALIQHFCLYSEDHNAFSPTQASLVAVKLVPGGGGAPSVWTIPNSTVATTPGAGFASYCSDAIAYTLRSTVDVDGDGVADAVAYYLKLTVAPTGRIGGATLTWHRQVSPPPDVPTFADVPASDGGFPYIEALAAAGITTGCGGSNYCPGASLTRRQMAVYLSKALGLYWPN